MVTYPFLSEPWIAECRRLRGEYRDRIKLQTPASLKMNLIVTDVPHEERGLNAHLDTSGGQPEIELGHLTDAEVTVTLDYPTARSVLVDGNMGAAMEGLQLGRIQVAGDIMKVMSLAGLSVDPGSIELAKKIRSITE